MAFTNTVESVGDAALMRSIIDKSITELNCNITTSIRQQAFRACAALASVNFPSVTSVATGAFWNCTALAKADFSAAVAFANNAFYGCSALTALILRNTEQISTISGTPFASSAIASGTGYIYVPAALVDQYKASWTAYAAQIRAIEDYVGIIDPYTWAGVAANIADGSYTSVYKVGDTVPLDMGTEGQINMEIRAFDADELADGTGMAAISWVAKELLKTTHRMNPALVTNTDGTYQEGTGAIGGWEKSEMRSYLNDTIFPMIPDVVRAMIRTVTKYSLTLNTSTGKAASATTNDKVFIPSKRELANTIGNVEFNGPVYYASSDDKKKSITGGTSYYNWWLRTGYDTLNTSFCEVYSSVSNRTAETARAVCLCFCT